MVKSALATTTALAAALVLVPIPFKSADADLLDGVDSGDFARMSTTTAALAERPTHTELNERLSQRERIDAIHVNGTNYTVRPEDQIIIFRPADPSVFQVLRADLPPAAAMAGMMTDIKVIFDPCRCFIVDLFPVPGELIEGESPRASIHYGSSLRLYSDGVEWHIFQGQF